MRFGRSREVELLICDEELHDDQLINQYVFEEPRLQSNGDWW